jgi:hypothetical protein
MSFGRSLRAITLDIGTQVPDLQGFASAQDEKRSLLGSPITFYWPAVVTYPPGVQVNPENGEAFDPVAASAASATRASASAVCTAFFKAVNRGGAANAETAAPIGFVEKTRLFLNVASADGQVLYGLASANTNPSGAVIQGLPSGQTLPGGIASEFQFHGNRYQIYAIKDDTIVGGYRRTLVYGAAIGADASSDFYPGDP